MIRIHSRRSWTRFTQETTTKEKGKEEPSKQDALFFFFVFALAA
jgi:hypothetical protein